VRSFFENGFHPNDKFTDFNDYNKIYVVGKKTKQELRKNGYGSYKVLPYATDLSEFIVECAGEEKFIHFCGNLSIDILDKALPLQNIAYKKVTIYDTELLYPRIEGKYDAAVFFSPSGVRSFAKFNSFEDLVLFSIGTTTENELKKYTQQPIYTSKNANLDEVLELINNHSFR